MTTLRTRHLSFPLLLALLVLSSCSRSTEVLPREDLFTLGLGKLEHQVDLFRFENYQDKSANSIFMRSGIFTLSNGRARKIMELSSYGDLLSLYYSPQYNPRPVTLGTDAGSRNRQRSATVFEFASPGHIAVNRKGELLVEDLSPDSQKVFDKELGITLDRVILRFNQDRTLMDYLGQEGVGGSPFPVIEAIHVTNADDVVVVTRTLKSYLVFWFDQAGRRKFLVDIPYDTVPVPEIGQWQVAVRKVIPDPDTSHLHVQIDYYPLQDLGGRIESSISRINLLSREWEALVPVPYAHMAEDAKIQSLHDFLGVSPGGLLLLASRWDNERHELIILDRSGRLIQKRFIDIPDSTAVEQSLALSADGILYGFFVYQEGARVSWWRTDTLLMRSGLTR